MRRRLVALALLGLAPACGSEAPADDAGDLPLPEIRGEDICDGSSELKLLARSVGHSSQSVVYGSGGGNFLLIDGQCRFWAGIDEDEGLLLPPSTGTLEPEHAAEIANRFGYASWPEWSGGYWEPNLGAWTKPWIELSDFEGTIRCGVDCRSSGNEDLPPPLKDLASKPQLQETWREVYAVGQPLETRRLLVEYARNEVGSVGDGFDPEDWQMLEWPFSVPPGTPPFVQGEPPEAVLVDDPGLVEELRTVRDRFLNDELPEGTWNPVVDDGFDYLQFVYADGDTVISPVIWMREMLPAERGEAPWGLDVPE